MISPRLPYAKGKADSMTVFHIAQYLSKSHDVYIACFYDDPSELSNIDELNKFCCEVRCIKLNKCKALLNIVLSLFSKNKPMQTAYYSDKHMDITVEDMLNKYQPDIVYAHLIRMAEYLKERKSFRRVLAMQISQTLNYRRMIENIRLPFYKYLYNIEYRKVLNYEPAITKTFDSCLLISRHDKEALNDHEDIDNIFYSPHGIDVDYYTCSGAEQKEDALLFCGVLETPTNIDAVMYFYEQIYPLVKQKVPGVKLYLVGKRPAKIIRKIAECDDSVILTGFVDDIRTYYSRIKVGIDPLRIGAGLQNKLIIGMSMGQPMVCTSVANEGISAENGKHLVIADDPSNFADSIIDLMFDRQKAERISKQARTFVRKYWTWEYYLEKLDAHLRDVASKKIL